MRRVVLVAGFVVSAAVILGALVWISHLALDLEARERAARQRATFEASVRLALWRMDSATASLLAQENARPVDATAATPSTPWGAAAAQPPPGASPIARPSVVSRFELAPQGLTWAPAAAAPPAAADPLRDPERLLAALGQGAPVLLASTEAAAGSSPKRRPPVSETPSGVGAGAARPAAPPSTVKPLPVAPEPSTAAGAPALRARTEERSADHPAVGRQAPGAQAAATGDPLAQELAHQSVLNRAEFAQRNQQSQAFEPLTQAPASGGAAVADRVPEPSAISALPALPTLPTAAPAPVPEPAASTAAAARPGRRRAIDLGARPAAVAALPPSPGRPLGPLVAAWVGDDLILSRRVRRGRQELLQGARLDGNATRAWLAAQAHDLLPSATLLALQPGQAADPGRRLALLPLRLEPGPLPAAASPGSSPLRLGLTLAGVAVVLAIAGAALQLAAAQRLAQRRADFVSAVSHELRTPLTTFRLYTEMLATDMVPVGERAGYLRTLRDEADRLGHLVENVLFFARLDRRRGRSQLEVVAVGDLVSEVAERLRQPFAAAATPLMIEMDPPAVAARVRVDRVAVGRILQNLSDNALKYGRSATDPRVHFSVALTDRGVTLTLRDHGRGLDRSVRRRLFRPFHRSAELASGDAPGVGLGLALSRRLARDFGGDLRAIDPPGGGAAFELRLPLTP